MASTEYTYQRPSDDELIKIIRYFDEEIKYFMDYVFGSGESIQYHVCGLDIIDTVIRVDKRLKYFRIFHNMDINECKKAALYAYWLVKFRPIKITDPKHTNRLGYNDRVNELFAVHHLTAVLSGIGKIQPWDGTSGVRIDMETPYIKELSYSFRYRNLSIDSMIVLADAITTDTFK